ncbi:hypothetical protein [Nocardia xishanensis]|uniref:hypothetical protein n=1 Tax=Nocardia xishanensis TaxID=238964 RepID=UPI00082AB8F7|nr:hypothetical protein [Nocardia xishanensis]
MSQLSYRSKLNKLYEWRKLNGIPSVVDATPILAHILELKALGLTDSMIARAAECSSRSIGFIVDGTTKVVRVPLAGRILAVNHLPDPRQHWVLTVGARRRIRALSAIGWPTKMLASRLGMSSRHKLNESIKSGYMTYTRWAQIRDLYDELSGTPGPSPKSVERSQQLMHAPPLAWDGIDIDHPHSQPNWQAMGVKLADRPVCVKGHQYTPENTGRDDRGNRYCRICRRNSNARRRAEIAAQKAAGRQESRLDKPNRLKAIEARENTHCA